MKTIIFVTCQNLGSVWKARRPIGFAWFIHGWSLNSVLDPLTFWNANHMRLSCSSQNAMPLLHHLSRSLSWSLEIIRLRSNNLLPEFTAACFTFRASKKVSFAFEFRFMGNVTDPIAVIFFRACERAVFSCENQLPFFFCTGHNGDKIYSYPRHPKSESSWRASFSWKFPCVVVPD